MQRRNFLKSILISPAIPVLKLHDKKNNITGRHYDIAILDDLSGLKDNVTEKEKMQVSNYINGLREKGFPISDNLKVYNSISATIQVTTY